MTPRAPRRYFNCSSPGVQACSLPASCCIDPQEDGASVNDQCGFGALGLDEDAAQRVVHLEGCGAPLRQWLRGNIRAVGGFAIAVVVVQGAELLLATQLVRALAVRKGATKSRTGGAAGPVQPSRPRADPQAPGWGAGLRASSASQCQSPARGAVGAHLGHLASSTHCALGPQGPLSAGRAPPPARFYFPEATAA